MTALFPAVRVGPVAFVVRLRSVTVGVVAFAGALALALVAISIGDYTIPIGKIIDVLFGGGTKIERHIILNLRLPRALAALLVGAAFGLSGALTQTVARNPLASPDVLGVTEGAAVGAVAVIVLGGAGGVAFLPTTVAVPIAALIGALVAAVAIYTLAWRRGIEGYRLILIGVAVGEVLSGAVSWFLVRAEIVAATRATVWLNGSLQDRDWTHVLPLVLALAVLIPLGVVATFATRALALGEETARGLGVRLQSAQFGVIAVAVGLAAAAVAAAGPIGFVAFVTPQIALRLCGGSQPPPVVSALLGALLLSAADLGARFALPSRELPVGLVTAMVGAPYLLWLLTRTYRRTLA